MGKRDGGGAAAPPLPGRAAAAREEGYEEARRVWNGAIDRRPAMIARAAGADDVVEAVRFARERDLPVSVDPGTGTVRAADGVLLGELDRATQRFGLVAGTEPQARAPT